MAGEHLTQAALAARWQISPRTLERWRWIGQGPQYLKVGGQVRYRLTDIELFETERLSRPAPARPACGTVPLRVVLAHGRRR